MVSSQIPFRVLHICPELPSAGRPGSMAPTARQIESLQDLGVRCDVVDMRGIRGLKYAQRLPRIRRLARSADVVHAHFGYCGWLAKIATVGLQVPVVVSFMGDDLLGTPRADGSLERFSRFMVRRNIRLAQTVEQVIVKSREMAGVLAPLPVSVIPNGVDLAGFCPIASDVARQRLGLPTDAKLVLFPGNPENPRKGYGLARGAVDLAEQLTGESIQLVPLWNVAPQQVPTYMNSCDAMLMTSLIEGSPNVVKEAMACDLPVVGVPVGDVPELLEGVPGYCVCPRDSLAIGERLAERLRSHSPILGRQAITEKGLDLERVSLRVLAVYESVLGRKFLTRRSPSASLRPKTPSSEVLDVSH